MIIALCSKTLIVLKIFLAKLCPVKGLRWDGIDFLRGAPYEFNYPTSDIKFYRPTISWYGSLRKSLTEDMTALLYVIF